MGIYNAVSALAGVIGAGLGGWFAARWGYNASSGLAMAAIALALSLAMAIRHAANDALIPAEARRPAYVNRS
jgi:ABC-type methionine transport system permease subunit